MLKEYDQDKDGFLAKDEFLQLQADYLRDKRLRALHPRWTVKSARLNMRDAAASEGSQVIAQVAKGDELIEVSLDGAWLRCKLVKEPSTVGCVLTASAEGRKKPYVLKNVL